MPNTAFTTYCPQRRDFLRIGLGGFASLSLPGLFRLRAEAASDIKKPTAVILLWLKGGLGHIDTLDPKPDASLDYRGLFQPISTKVPGIQITEILPRLAGLADRYAILRSMAHAGSGHGSGSLAMFSADADVADKPFPRYPDWMSVATYLRSGRPRSIPSYVTVNPVSLYGAFTITGPATLGPKYKPLEVHYDFNNSSFKVPDLRLSDAIGQQRLINRVALRQDLDRLRRDVDRSGMIEAVDEFEAQAINLLLNATTAEAFDLTHEPDAVRDRYGRHQWGEQCLLARRLVQAGVEIVTTDITGPPCGRAMNWDDHAVNQHIFDALSYRAPPFDQAVSALIEDIYHLGLDQQVLVVVAGEFGRTPRISHVASSGEGVASAPAGTVQPGRDHWPQAASILFAGGGICTGQVIGATNARGEEPVDRRVGPEDFMATIYTHLGIDVTTAAIRDISGRPVPIIHNGHPIAELARQGSS